MYTYIMYIIYTHDRIKLMPSTPCYSPTSQRSLNISSTRIENISKHLISVGQNRKHLDWKTSQETLYLFFLTASLRARDFGGAAIVLPLLEENKHD